MWVVSGVSGESSQSVCSRLAPPYARQAKRSTEIIGVVCRALGGRPGAALDDRADVKIAAVRYLGIAPKPRQNRIKYSKRPSPRFKYNQRA